MNNINLLESKRLTGGEKALKAEFLSQAGADRENGALLVNDARTTFPTLYILIPELESTGLLDRLNERNAQALAFCAKVAGNRALPVKLNLPGNAVQTMQPLVWIVSTGASADGLNDEYDEIMDKAASLLLVKYGEKSVVPAVVDMIFKRGSAGKYNHDLIWALFKSGDKDAFKRVASYLRSPKPEDAELARGLLCFVPGRSLPVSAGGRADEYTFYVNWLNANAPYLAPTVESNQYSSLPKAYELDVEAKYLGIPAEQKASATPSQLRYLEKLEGLDDEQRAFLAEASAALRARSVRAWTRWLDSPADSQLVMARTMAEGRI